MTDSATPLVPEEPNGLGGRLRRAALAATLRASLLVSPRPAALLVRRVFADGGARTRATLDRHAPAGVVATRDLRYADEPEALLDVTRSATATGRQPLVVWVHGGGWVGGSKDEQRGYAAVLAAGGVAVAMPDYSLAPEHRYPTPVRQTMRALAYLVEHADELGVDAGRIVLAGDSAGAQIAAQVAALVTTPGYAERVGVPATIASERLRGVVLACGPYDLRLLLAAGTPTGRRLVRAILWAYSGARHPGTDARLASWSVTEHVTAAFPPALVTVGNADSLRGHSALLVERLAAQGVPVETVLWPEDHRPPLGHEYQFDLDGDAGQVFLDRLRDFLDRRLLRG